MHVQSDPKSERVSDLTSSIAEHAAPPSNPSAFPSYSQHRKSPRPSLMSPDEMPYIPMLRINEPSRPTFLRAFSSPPGELHSRSLSKNMSKEENTVENSQAASSAVISSTSLPLKPSGMVRAPISPPAVSRNFLKSLNPGPILDHTVSSPKHNIQQQSIPPRPPKIVPPHVLAGYRDHSRKPTSFIPIYDSNLKTASPSTSKAIRIPITSTEDIEGRNLTLRPSPDYSVARRVPSSETGACPVPKTGGSSLAVAYLDHHWHGYAVPSILITCITNI